MKQRIIRLAALSVVLVVVLVGGAFLLLPFPGRWVADYPAACRVADADGGVMRVVVGRSERLCHPVELVATGDWCGKALIAAEDKRFYTHHGLDPIAIVRATAWNLRFRRIVSGASTLTTQVIRMVTDRPRTLSTKLMEGFRAVQLEAVQPKARILEQYLNRAPMGGNVYGVEAAAKKYFGKCAADLSIGEAALLMGLPQSPSRYRPDRHLARALRRRRYVLDRMVEQRFITRSQRAVALATPLDVRSEANPFTSPHFSDLVVARHPEAVAAFSGRGVTGPLHTTLRPEVQQLLEGAAARHRERLASVGAEDMAIVVLDVAAGALVGLVGSYDYGETRRGQVNGALARRSPGSALKPFIYADALDQGRLTPASLVYDVPVRVGDYEPANYDRTCAGPVSLRSALVQSLNMPAIRELHRMGVPRLGALLSELGIDVDRDHGAYGLSMALGSCEVSLLDLANGYAAIARGGRYRELHLIAHKADTRGAGRLFSEEACYLLADMLGGSERPLPELGGLADVRCPRVAWKTGTSTGHRDAWTVAFNPEYVVAVWVGNADGHPGVGINGTRDAAPVALGVMRDLYPGGDAPWFDRPAGIEVRSVCALSGARPARECPLAIDAAAIRGVSSPERCQIHRNGAEHWPPAVAAFLRERQPAGGGSGGASVAITSPRSGTELQVAGDAGSASPLVVFRARTTVVPTSLSWFVDGVALNATRDDGSVAWYARPGAHHVVCVTPSGASDGIRIVVRARAALTARTRMRGCPWL
jgi:penicillin-binding protein 1C